MKLGRKRTITLQAKGKTLENRRTTVPSWYTPKIVNYIDLIEDIHRGFLEYRELPHKALTVRLRKLIVQLKQESTAVKRELIAQDLAAKERGGYFEEGK